MVEGKWDPKVPPNADKRCLVTTLDIKSSRCIEIVQSLFLCFSLVLKIGLGCTSQSVITRQMKPKQ